MIRVRQLELAGALRVTDHCVFYYKDALENEKVLTEDDRAALVRRAILAERARRNKSKPTMPDGGGGGIIIAGAEHTSLKRTYDRNEMKVGSGAAQRCLLM
jgi:hypothetical protein